MQAVQEHDYIVVGAGSAGAVIASRLTEDPGTSVLLLEAGGRPRHPFLDMPIACFRYHRKPDLTFQYESEPEAELDGRRAWLPRGKALGGSSAINGMLYARGHPLDYDGWRQLGNEGWGYADVLPYFKRSERSWRGAGTYHGGSGPLAVSVNQIDDLLYAPLAAATAAAGYPVTDDPHGDQPEGITRAELTVDRGRRASTAHAFLYPALKRPNLAVVTHALATRVIVENGRAVGVEYRQGGQIRRAFAAREVILSLGAYGSPQLLMLSGIGPAEDLKALGIDPVLDLPGVGGNLSEHPVIFTMYRAARPVTLLRQLRADRAVLNVLRWRFLGAGPFATNGCSANIFLPSRPELARPDVQMSCGPLSLDAGIWFPVVKPPVPHRFQCGIYLLHPESRGRVTLRSADPAAAPVIRLNLFAAAGDIETLVRGLRMARAIYRQKPQADLIESELAPGDACESDADLTAYIRRNAVVSHHPVGTCAMGHGPMAVVDPELRVRGIEGLRVADASIMPDEPGGNTNAPTIMIGEKAADLIRGRRLPPTEL